MVETMSPTEPGAKTKDDEAQRAEEFGENQRRGNHTYGGGDARGGGRLLASKPIQVSPVAGEDRRHPIVLRNHAPVWAII